MRIYTLKVTFYERSDEFWEDEIKTPDDLKEYVVQVFDECGFSEGEDVAVQVEGTNDNDTTLYELADALHIAQSIMGELKRKFDALPDDVRSALFNKAVQP